MRPPYAWFKNFLNHASYVYLDHKSMQVPTCWNIPGLPHSALLRTTATFLSLLGLIRQHRFISGSLSSWVLPTHSFRGRGYPAGQALGFDFCYLNSYKHLKLKLKFSQFDKGSQGKNSLGTQLISQHSYFCLCVCLFSS